MAKQPTPTGRRTLSFEQLPAPERDAELDRLPSELAQERSWLKEAKPSIYEDKRAVLGAIALGTVVVVSSGMGLPFRQYYQRGKSTLDAVARLPENECSVPYLRPEALSTLLRVTAMAEQRFQDSGDGRDYLRENELSRIQYSVTSMLRTQQYQRKLLERGALALDGNSAHSYGLAFDVDHSGYYVVRRGSGEVMPVNGIKNPHLYNDSPIHAFQSALEEAAAANILAFITELPQGRGCWHITGNPELSPAAPAQAIV